MGDEPLADVVFECAGTASALAEAVERVRPGGTVVVPATYWDPIELPALSWFLKEVHLVPASMYARPGGGERDIDRAARLLAATPDLGSALVTHRFPLDGAVEAFTTAGDRASGAIKVVLDI